MRAGKAIQTNSEGRGRFTKPDGKAVVSGFGTWVGHADPVPSHKPVVWYKGFLYQAASWKTARRVVAKVEFYFGELFPRVGFIVTNLETPSRAVVRFYNKRGTAEQWIKEGKQAVKMTRLSCHRFRSNQVRLALSLLAYNLGNL